MWLLLVPYELLCSLFYESNSHLRHWRKTMITKKRFMCCNSIWNGTQSLTVRRNNSGKTVFLTKLTVLHDSWSPKMSISICGVRSSPTVVMPTGNPKRILRDKTSPLVPCTAARIPGVLRVLNMSQNNNLNQTFFEQNCRGLLPCPTSRTKLAAVAFNPDVELLLQTRIIIGQIVAAEVICEQATPSQ